MLKLVLLKNLRPNPFRRLDEYPIQREKVDSLKESIESTGFWGTIVGRPKGDLIEIAFGHHRLTALQELKADYAKIEMIVRDLTNEQMLQMMARENMEEWGTSAWVELETIRSVIDSYGKGLIELPEVPKDTREKYIRNVSLGSATRSYTKTTVAEFLGWTKNSPGGLQPNYGCEIAFAALDAIEKDLLKESDMKGLPRREIEALVRSQKSIHDAELQRAKEERRLANEAKEKAKLANGQDRRRHEKQAEVHEEQAKAAERSAKPNAIKFAKEAVETLRSGGGIEKIKQDADLVRPVIHREQKIISVDEYADRLDANLKKVANGEDAISVDAKWLAHNKVDLSPHVATSLCLSIDALIDRLQRIKKRLEAPDHARSPFTISSHKVGTEN